VLEKFYLRSCSERKGRTVQLFRGMSNGITERVLKVGELRGWRLNLAQPAITESLRHSRAKISRRIEGNHILINEEDGIRLHLAFRGVSNLMGVSRASEFISGVYDLSREEAYYWYAKTQNGSAGRGLRSLRVLLAGVV